MARPSSRFALLANKGGRVGVRQVPRGGCPLTQLSRPFSNSRSHLGGTSTTSPTTSGWATALFGVLVLAAVPVYFATTSTGHSVNYDAPAPVSSFSALPRSQKSTTLLSEAPPVSHDTSAASLEACRAAFVALLGEAGVNSHAGDLRAHSSTAWSESPLPTDHAALIVYPRSTADVSAIATICHAHRVPMTGFSGGTSLEGALAATRGGVCVDFRDMAAVLAVHERDMDVVVQPGLDWQRLNELLAPHGFFFPVDPGPGACIGGMIGTGCSGTNAYRYGTMKDWVVSVTVVLADGTVIKTRRRPRKSSAGYDLTRLFVGASGTLGLVTEVVLKITAKPANVRVAVVAFPNIPKAVDTAVQLVQKAVPVAAMELVDEIFMKAINESGYMEEQWAETPSIFFKFSGSTPAEVKEQMAVVERVAKENAAQAFTVGETPQEVDGLWGARKTALWSLLAMKDDPDDQFLSSDVAVPISRLADIVGETKQKILESGLKGAVLGHVGDGNFHAAILYGAKDKLTAERIIHEIQQSAIAMDGTVTGEHGIGLTFRDALEDELGKETIAAMRQMKLALDPLCLLNCDKVFRMEAGR